MKKKLNHGSSKKRTIRVAEDREGASAEEPAVKVDPLDEEDQGFGGWLSSSDGLDTMKLFVVANSIVMLTTLVFPHLQTCFGIIYDMVYGEDVLY